MDAKKIFACLLVSVIALTLFGCAEETETDIVLPDIVFVKFNWDCGREIAGEYIDKDGNIRNFDFTHGEWKEYDYRYDLISNVKKIYQYPDVRNVKTVNDMIIQHYKESDENDIVGTVSAEDLNGYFSELLQVNTSKKMKVEGWSYLDVIDPWACMYGIRKNSDGADEIVFIREYETSYLTTKEKNTNSLFAELGGVFSEMENVPLYGW
ncbi:MAG: hypothetical protein K2G87_07060 [Oscillospiraceae bacterium]|nr:hypothetical protein [Oscillospiraceae bacterium]